MTTIYAVLGNTPELSQVELEALTGNPVSLILPTVGKVTTDLTPVELGNMLGGTIKLITKLKETTKESLLSDLTSLIKDNSQKNVAITSLTTLAELSEGEVHSIKDEVSKSRPIRFLSLETKDHSLVALRKQHVAEFVVFADQGDLIIGQTVWIQDADDWTNRDRSKPYRDIKRGMLPPKVARIMVNLACQGEKGLTLADPFCGTGTVLSEGAMVGCTNLIGSDTNVEAIAKSPNNLSWLKDVYQLNGVESSFKVLDATHFDKSYDSVDAIATEPYMGPLLESTNEIDVEKIKNIARGLSKLYIGALKSWHKVLTGKGRVVISIPQFVLGSRTISTLKVDDYARLGYNYISSVAYGKPGAIVVRNITILTKA